MHPEEPLKGKKLPTGLAVVRTFPRRRAARDYGLVVLSMGLPYWLVPQSGRVVFCVEEKHLDAVLEQLSRHERENHNWPPRVEDLPVWDLTVSPTPFSFFVVFLIGFFIMTQFDPAHRIVDILASGRMSSVAVLQDSEWWRLVTALCLHKDIGHILANIVAGVFFIFWVCRGLGSGLGWLLVILSGVLGNLITAATYFPSPHYSIGASTAIFGALGLVVGRAVSLPDGFPVQWSDMGKSTRWQAILAGFALLALLGTGGETTDILAHLFGFLTGVPLGILAHRSFPSTSRVFQKWMDPMAYSLSLIILTGSWLIALRFG